MGNRVVAVGIDLGTTNSAIAYVDEYDRPVVIPSRLGEPITPSVVCFQPGRVLIGREAKDLQAAGEPVAAFFKRQMGVRDFVFYADGRDHTAIDLSARVLRSLAEDAALHLGQPVRDAVITVPAYFRNPQREATIEAGRMAGLNVIQTINEPTAAAFAYGCSVSEREETLLVYDLGGGTFDVTLLRLTNKNIEILTSDGDHELGGKDWDDRVIEFLASRFREEFGADPLADAVCLGDLLVRAEDAKKRLSSATNAVISIMHDGARGRYELTRSVFDQITRDLMERTISLTRKVLTEQSLTPEDINGVLLVGGSTRMPMVHQFITQTFGKPPRTGVNVDEAVALGAALQASEQVRRESQSPPLFALRARPSILDVTNHSLGMVAINENRSAFINSVILSKNTQIPCAQTRPYQYRAGRGQTSLEVFVTQGESEQPGDVCYLGKYIVGGIVPSPGSSVVIDIEYRYSESGTVSVMAKQRSSGHELTVTVEPLPPDVPDRFLKPPEHTASVEHVTVYLAFDLSGSMSGTPLLEAKKAARSFLANIDLTHCSVGIIAFSDRVQVKVEACQNAKTVADTIEALQTGETGYGNAAHPFDDIQKYLQGGSSRRFAIVLADGIWGCQAQAVQQAKACHATGIEVIAIGFGGADLAFLRNVASSDEGAFLTSMGALVETFTTIAQVLTESGRSVPSGTATGKSMLGFFPRD